MKRRRILSQCVREREEREWKMQFPLISEILSCFHFRNPHCSRRNDLGLDFVKCRPRNPSNDFCFLSHNNRSSFGRFFRPCFVYLREKEKKNTTVKERKRKTIEEQRNFDGKKHQLDFEKKRKF